MHTLQHPVTASDPPAPGPADAWLRVAHSIDIDEHAAAQPNWSLRYDQMSGGGFAGKLTLVQLPGLRMVREDVSCAARQRGEIGDSHHGFAMALHRCDDVHFSGQRLDHDSMMIGSSRELDLASPAGFGLVGIVVERTLLGSLWERLYDKPLSAWLDRQVVATPRPGIADALRATHLKLVARIVTTPGLLDDAAAVRQLRDQVLIEWIEAIPERVETAPLKSVEARRRVVERACEVMLAQRERSTSILELCCRIGASPRKLEYCFRDVLGITPAKYLRALRLHGARRELKRGGGGVHDIAARWGFWHCGEFSADYRRQFGELPSQTLRRARGAAGACPLSPLSRNRDAEVKPKMRRESKPARAANL